MAIPTQFSVTNNRSAPIANPVQPIDGANQLTAESIGFISGASALPVKSAGDINAPSELVSQAASDIDTPSELTAQLIGGIDNASLFSALSVGTINNPSVVTAEPVAPVDNDINLVNAQAFNFTNTDNGWTIENGTTTLNATSIIISNTTNDMRFIRESVDYNKESSYIVRVRVRCTTGNVSDTATLLYKNANHGYGPDYAVSKSVTYEQGVYQIINFNMRGYDFSQFGADGIRLDLYNQAAPESFEIDYIHVGAYDAGFTVNLPKSIAAPSSVTAESQPSVALPSAVTAESAPSIAAPSTLTANAGTQTSGNFPLNHARILHNNVLFSYSSVTQNKGVNSQLAIVPNTWQRWEFSGGGAMTITLPNATSIDSFCVGAHNLGDYTYSVGVEYSATDTGAWVALSSGKNPTTNDAMFFYSQSTVSAKRIRLTCSGDGLASYIGYVSAGVALQMQRPFFNGHQPYTDSDVTEYYSKRTESGERIGREIRRKGFETSFEWQNIDDEWYRNNIPALKKDAKKYPIFVAWNLLEYPNDIAFGETTGDIKASMQNGTRIKRSGLSFTLEGV